MLVLKVLQNITLKKKKKIPHKLINPKSETFNVEGLPLSSKMITVKIQLRKLVRLLKSQSLLANQTWHVAKWRLDLIHRSTC